MKRYFITFLTAYISIEIFVYNILYILDFGDKIGDKMYKWHNFYFRILNAQNLYLYIYQNSIKLHYNNTFIIYSAFPVNN